MYELGNSFENILALILGISFLLLFSLLIATIIHKAGYHWAWVFIWFVPLINLIFYIIFALKKWPIQERLEECQRENREIQKALMGSIQKTGQPESIGPCSSSEGEKMRLIKILSIISFIVVLSCFYVASWNNKTQFETLQVAKGWLLIAGAWIALQSIVTLFQIAKKKTSERIESLEKEVQELKRIQNSKGCKDT